MISDVLIVGGGMTGSLLACALGYSKLFTKISVIDALPSPVSTNNPIPDPRVVTLTPASKFFMSSIGTWDLIPETRIGKFSSMQIWDYYGTGEIKFENSSGWVVENKELVQANLQRLKDLEIEVLSPVKVKAITRKTRKVFVELEDGRKLETSLIVGADGKESKVRNELGIGNWCKPYPHNGMVCIVKIEGKLNQAYQRFLQTGPLALLPLWENYYSVVWSAPPDIIDTLVKAFDNDFITQINLALSSPSLASFPNQSEIISPKVIEICTEKFSFPYALMYANSFVGPRVALVGDAAHTIHPMAGQGYNLGVYDVANLANILCQGAKIGRDPGHLAFLQAYGNKSKGYNSLLAEVEESILLSYSDIKALHYARNFAYSTIGRMPLVKDAFQKAANGFDFIPQKFEWEKT
ncbi:hypothetical protein SteCoe_23379 [Stentor coeruleus]|uniref:FAD-binding domain-containing protein n=1 Tax=Stentor coeruleus TaxID=5963 RepID=A0A1R2BK19_9CILI|nr:hypothetical protein SteCoe_23379 [Stentor coeruleus]